VSLGFSPFIDGVDNKNANNVATPLVRDDKSFFDMSSALKLDFDQDFTLFESSSTEVNSLITPAPLLHDHQADNNLSIDSFIDFTDDVTFGIETFDSQTGSGSAVFSCDGAGLAA